MVLDEADIKRKTNANETMCRTKHFNKISFKLNKYLRLHLSRWKVLWCAHRNGNTFDNEDKCSECILNKCANWIDGKRERERHLCQWHTNMAATKQKPME